MSTFEDLDANFAEAVRSARISRGLSQLGLANLVNDRSGNAYQFTQQTIARIEAQTRRITGGEGVVLATVLGGTIENILGLGGGFYAEIDPRDRIEGAIRELEERARGRAE